MTDTAAAARRGEGISTLLRPIRRRLALLNKKIDDQPKFRWAWVTSTSPLRIRLEGDSLPLEITPSVATAVPGVGAKVLTLLQNRQCTIVGTPDGQGSGVGGRGTNLIPGADGIGATGSHAGGSPPGFSAFGYNSTYGEVWAQSDAAGTGPTLDTDTPFFIEKGVTYRFEVTAHASVANTRYYVQMWDPDSDSAILGKRGGGVPTSYVAQNVLAGATRGGARTHALEWTPDISSRAVLRFLTSHTVGASNPNGYQWFKGIRFVALEDRAHNEVTLPVTGATGTARIRTVGAMRFLEMDITFTNALATDAEAQNFATIPAGYRPPVNTPLSANGWASRPATALATTEGNVTLRNIGPSQRRYIISGVW